jgi:cobalt-zinc-cadmium efflux system membrane fusion protein
LVTGCGKKEAAKEEKQAVGGEKKEPGHESGHGAGHGDEHKGEHEAEESDVVTLTPEKQKSSGIVVKQVATENAAIPLSATAAIEMNMDRSAKISARVTGKATRIIASQGDRVKAGQALAYLDSAELDQTWADYLKAGGSPV